MLLKLWSNDRVHTSDPIAYYFVMLIAFIISDLINFNTPHTVNYSKKIIFYSSQLWNHLLLSIVPIVLNCEINNSQKKINNLNQKK